ncbi:thioredoxin family protein [Winogradskyella echinorum]|uniref:Thioredoxin family protein n=1 Tax=Winogradskyella echinorum TaxID=538189 RepID=A0ABR6XWJ4_9FLAO|nr:cytochrome c biogenesis protein CcdA [Winogradskyella echinorum]MBC3844867.1 thioredoxin family protein [Winogradskyella echinorum]MBC5749215.1 thioredoxin family protein [Winogradskyella echinorum]
MTIKKVVLLCLLAFCFSFNLSAQELEPVKWETSVEKISDTEYNLVFKAAIEKGWYMYSQEEPEGLGPYPTYFEYRNQDGNYKLIGETLEPNVKPKFDKVFEIDVKKFDGVAQFSQRISLLNKELSIVEVNVTHQVCDDAKCIMQDFTFNFSLDGTAIKEKVIEIDDKSKQLSEELNLNVTGWDKYEKQSVEGKSYFGIFLLGFLGGLIALLTPCVFPMIPLTVSFFTKSSGDSKKGLFNSVLYGLFIFLIYVLLSIPFHVMDSLDSGILNTISTNVTLNIIFFIIFVVFSFSFFGYFELTLPQSWSAAMDNKANKIGGIMGIFFMALTLAIVSFSCTGPILGGLLGSTMASDASAMQLSMGMGGFGLALALPFTLFAMFPKWLNSLPKSGGWLNTVKVVLGFIELALALKFLSNADLVEHWGILKREIFIGLWIIIAIGLALYIFGKIRFPHDSPLQKLSKYRVTTGILLVAFIIYLIPGLTNTKHANLKLLSGFPPPMFYSLYDKSSDCPLDLNCYKDLDEGITAAKAENKPILLDFTGWACVNCRKMEEQVWSTSQVYEMLQDNYVIISLYVDDKKELPEAEQFQYLRTNGTIKNIETIGDKWGTLQTINFQNNSQPFYVLLDENMQLLNTTNAYEPNADAYFNWLKVGLENFKNKPKFKF